MYIRGTAYPVKKFYSVPEERKLLEWGRAAPQITISLRYPPNSTIIRTFWVHTHPHPHTQSHAYFCIYSNVCGVCVCGLTQNGHHGWWLCVSEVRRLELNYSHVHMVTANNKTCSPQILMCNIHRTPPSHLICPVKWPSIIKARPFGM